MREYKWYNAPYEWSFGKDRMRSALEDIGEPKKRLVGNTIFVVVVKPIM